MRLLGFTCYPVHGANGCEFDCLGTGSGSLHFIAYVFRACPTAPPNRLQDSIYGLRHTACNNSTLEEAQPRAFDPAGSLIVTAAE